MCPPEHRPLQLTFGSHLGPPLGLSPASAEEAEEGESSVTKEGEKYGTFWKEFGRTIKLGIIEDAPNRPRLAKLLRVHTSAVCLSSSRQIVLSSISAVHHKHMLGRPC